MPDRSADTRSATADRIVVLSPNWLGDAVMALPAIADIRRAWPGAHLAVAVRPAVAGLFRFVPGIDATLTVPDGSAVPSAPARDATATLAGGAFEAAILLPNSFRSAWLAWRAGIPQRWGYRGDGRRLLLTRAVKRPRGAYHQSEYYQRLTAALGFTSGACEPRVEIPSEIRGAARGLLTSHGYDARSTIVVLAPGAAYGTAKQWIPAHVAALASMTTAEGSQCVLVGSRADEATGRAVLTALPHAVRARVVNVIGLTTLDMLAGVLAVANACVGNDSGATHLAAAIGTPVVSIFGPTNEQHSSPRTRGAGRSMVLTHSVWCRPCMLRDCPIDHSCMSGVTPDRAYAAVNEIVVSNANANANANPSPEP